MIRTHRRIFKAAVARVLAVDVKCVGTYLLDYILCKEK